jgi:hypothetical protein
MKEYSEKDISSAISVNRTSYNLIVIHFSFVHLSLS